MNLFQLDRNKFDPLVLPEPDGQPVTLQEKVYVPVKDYPDVSLCTSLEKGLGISQGLSWRKFMY